MSKKVMTIILALSMFFCLAACGRNSSEVQNKGTSQNDDSGQESEAVSQEEEESALSFPVPTQGEPPAIGSGINMVNLVPEGCVEVVYNEGVYLFKMSSMPTGETMVNFANELLIPEIQASSDTGTCLVRDPASNDVLGLERGVIPFRAFDSFGYRVSDGGAEYISNLIGGEQFGNEWLLMGSIKLLDVRYVYDGVLYDAITQVKEEEQAISVTPFEEPNQKFEIIE